MKIQATEVSAPVYLHVERYAPGLASVRLYMPARTADEVPYRPRVCIMPAAHLLALWRELRRTHPVRLYFH